MYLWKTLRLALLPLVLVHRINLSESGDSSPTKNPTSQNPKPTPSGPSGGQTGINPVTPPSQSSPSTPTSSEPKKDDKSESGKNDKSKSQLKGVMVAMDDEKTTAEFEFSKDDKTMTYTAKAGYGFSEIKWLRSKLHAMRADRNVWNTDNPFHLAHKVVVKEVGWLKYDLHIHLFDNKGFHVYHRPAWGSQWSYSGGIIRAPKLEPQKADNIPRTEHPKEIFVVTKGQTDAKDPKNSDPNYSVHKYTIKSKSPFYQYEFRDNHECTELKFEDKSVWTYDSTKANQGHPKSVFVFLNTKTVIFCFKEGVILVSRLDGDAWKSVFEGKPETCAVDIKNKASGAGFDFEKNDGKKIANYTAKDKHLINTVKTKELVLWNTDKLNQYATKVEVQGIGSSNKTLVLHLLNGNTKNFNKSGDNKPWFESGQSFPKHTFNELSPSNVKIITENPAGSDTPKTEDGSNPNENDSKYKENDSSQYELNPDDGNFFSYKFKDGAKCTEIKYDDESVWKHDQNDNKDHPKALYFHRGFRFFFFEISQESYRLYRRAKTDDNKYIWVCYTLKKVDPEFGKRLMLSYLNDNKLELSKDNDINTFGFGFEINIKEELKFVELAYYDKMYSNHDENQKQFWRKKIYDHDSSKYKNQNLVAIYLLDDLDRILVFDNFYIVFIDKSLKVDPKAAPTDGSSGQSGSGSTPTGGGTPSGGGSTPSGQSGSDGSGTNPSGGSTPSGGGGTQSVGGSAPSGQSGSDGSGTNPSGGSTPSGGGGT